MEELANATISFSFGCIYISDIIISLLIVVLFYFPLYIGIKLSRNNDFFISNVKQKQINTQQSRHNRRVIDDSIRF